MIISLKRNGRLVVAASIGDQSKGMTEKDLTLPENIPFWKIANTRNLYVGVSAVSYPAELFRFNSGIFKNVTDLKSITTLVVPKMKRTLARYGIFEDGKTWCNSMVILKDERIYEVDDCFRVSEQKEYSVLSTNYSSDMIEGALDATRNLSAEESILETLRTCSEMRDDRVFPVTLFDITDGKKKIFYR